MHFVSKIFINTNTRSKIGRDRKSQRKRQTDRQKVTGRQGDVVVVCHVTVVAIGHGL